MGLINALKLQWKRTASLFRENRDALYLYNYRFLCVLNYAALFIMFSLVLISYIPANTFFNKPSYHKFYMSFFFVFLSIAIATFLFGEYVKKHPLVFLYVFTFSMHIFATVMCCMARVPDPYTITLCFLVVFPICIMDLSFKLFVLNSLVVAVDLFFSYKFKDVGVFVTDIIDCVIFGIIGVVLGGVFRSYYLRYATIKAHSHDKDMELLKAKDEAKSTFLANMSHEIRTPINAIIGFDEMILRECADKTILNYANEINSSSRNLLSIINDILDFSKIESGKMEIICVKYDINSTLNDLINMITPRAKERGLEFIVNVNPMIPCQLYGDDIRIRQCILNLLTNAVKYTNKGSVSFTLDFRNGSDDETVKLFVSVKDTGIGIKKENIPKLFDSFDRLEERSVRSVEGTGLGLPITKSLLKKMGTELMVESEEGVGSTFSFEIEQKVASAEPIGNFSARIKSINEAHSTYSESFHAPTAKILVVDDMKINLTVIANLLKKTQIQLDTALSGDAAIDLVKHNKYDVIFIDHRMPGKDGLETIAEMRSDHENLNKSTPCIAFTANAIYGAREMFLRHGFVDYITKPVDYQKFEKLLMDYLPPELVVRNEEAKEEQPLAVHEEPSEHDDTFFAAYKNVPGVNIESALMHCGEESILKTAVSDFYDAIDKNIFFIEYYQRNGDWKNYTIRVHSLKSSSKLIGIEELSAEAAYLEKCCDEHNYREADEKTDALVQHYASYTGHLFPVVTPGSSPSGMKEVMEEKRFNEAYAAIKECVAVDDFDSCENIVVAMSIYEIPEKLKSRYKTLRASVYTRNKQAILETSI
ncbi:MAG TPA: hybrid sensor histidine kinase/response regulator [Treponema sp.]|nr:hybrid sensor histidine kinase/response regulator [Treponema sp.]